MSSQFIPFQAPKNPRSAWSFYGHVQPGSRNGSITITTVNKGETSFTERSSFLGDFDGVSYFALQDPTQNELSERSGHYWIKITPAVLMRIKLDWQADLIGRANAILMWQQSTRFCSLCGAPNSVSRPSGRRLQCTRNCTSPPSSSSSSIQSPLNIQFPRSDPSVLVLIVTEDDQYCLLVRGHHYPPGFYSAVSGFVDPGESVETAARREVLEETGISSITHLTYMKSQYWPFPATLMLGFLARVPSSLANQKVSPIDTEEIESCLWIPRNKIYLLLSSKPDSTGPFLPPVKALASQIMLSWSSVGNSKI